MELDPLIDWSGQGEHIRTEKRPMSNPANNSWKLLTLKLAVIGCIAVIFISLINLQIVNGAAFKQSSDKIRIRIEPIIAPRGIIYDRSGTPLVYNQDTFKAIIDTTSFDDTNAQIFPALAQLLGMSETDVKDIYKKGIDQHTAFIPLKDNITKEQMIEITSDPLYVGVRAEPSIIRVYPYKKLLTHVLGYVGPVTDAEQKDHPSLTSEDIIGKDGIEAAYDDKLRGVNGENILEVDTLGRVVNVIKTQDPIPGENLMLSLDVNTIQPLSDALAQGIKDSKATGGAAIVENVNDGSIISMISLPTFDDNLFSQGISEKDFSTLANDPTYPFLNRAIAGTYPPGSVMKTITAPAALQEHAITKDTIFYAGGTFEFGGREFQDYNKIVRGNLNVVGGLQWSSNIFFYNTILSLGINNFVKYEKLFGLGQLTGIDLPGEEQGVIASPLTKQEETGQVWYDGDSLNAAIGQGYTLVTPIQIVNWITSIANGGTLFKPHLLVKEESVDNTPLAVYNGDVVRQGFVKPENLDVVKQGMHAAVTSGIDATLHTSVVDIAGKTGTAEFGELDANGQYTHEHAWTSGFAPYDKPKIAFVVFLEGGGLSSNSERVAKTYMNWYFGTYLKQNPDKL